MVRAPRQLMLVLAASALTGAVVLVWLTAALGPDPLSGHVEARPCTTRAEQEPPPRGYIERPELNAVGITFEADRRIGLAGPQLVRMRHEDGRAILSWADADQLIARFRVYENVPAHPLCIAEVNAKSSQTEYRFVVLPPGASPATYGVSVVDVYGNESSIVPASAGQ